MNLELDSVGPERVCRNCRWWDKHDRREWNSSKDFPVLGDCLKLPVKPDRSHYVTESTFSCGKFKSNNLPLLTLRERIVSTLNQAYEAVSLLEEEDGKDRDDLLGEFRELISELTPKKEKSID